MISPNEPILFNCGQESKNRFMLAPMTNSQSAEDGQLSDDEFHWLTMRAKGQFGIVMTCASHVQEVGKGFPGQLGIYSDHLVEGHKRLTSRIRSYGSLSIIQLHHAGMRSPKELIGVDPVCPSSNSKYKARELTPLEVEKLRDDFIGAGVRAQACGYNGVEIHGAHGYVLSQFLSKEINHRNDKYGGSLENRSRIIVEIVEGIRQACGKGFMIGIRLSPERFGMDLQEIKTLSQQLVIKGNIDFLDISLWDSFKMPEDPDYKDQSLLDHFTNINLEHVKLTVAGKIRSGKDVYNILEAGVDFVSIGRSGILHHDFPTKVIQNKNFTTTETPVSENYLSTEGLGPDFINYMKKWPEFVK